MPSIAPAAKIAATRGYGANITFSGPTAPEREATVAKVIAETGARMVPPYNHPDIILGRELLSCLTHPSTLHPTPLSQPLIPPS